MIPAWFKRVLHLHRHSFNLEKHRKQFQRNYQRPILAYNYNSDVSYDQEYASSINDYSAAHTMDSNSIDHHQHHSHDHCIYHEEGNACGGNSTCATSDHS
ncbi:unnamed protein product [Adineta steineri]|uniref:Uncharacterized protein n=1 Tax=Adineta steineri TaxID=433720 RepID=A0A819EC53_9BILA|nr:unnamed protein product [Adineta steineri]CAF1372924.1 unnamed protein product [Adineta steineri]CAF3662765.1 unnamed protein product [Adineta steineri]CAF3848231.1 unnamed protein product [Adineta steineri]